MLISSSRLLQMLTVTKLAKNITAFYGTQRPTATFKPPILDPILSHKNPVHSLNPIWFRSTSVLTPPVPAPDKWLFPFTFSNQKFCLHLHFPLRITCQANLKPLDLITIKRRFPLCGAGPGGAAGYFTILFFLSIYVYYSLKRLLSC